MSEYKTGSVVITGASSGIGEAIARKFANQGKQLILAARRTDRIEGLADELQKITGVLPLMLDVSDRNAVFEALEALPEPYADVEILVNNAGLALGLEGADKADLDDWDQMVDTNIKGLMYCTRAILPRLIARGGGHLVNLGSVAASWPYPGGNAYGGTKAFVQQFSRNLRSDLPGKNIRITNIEPGMCDTEFSVVRFAGDEARAKAVYRGMQPLAAEDVAEIVYWVTALPAHINVNQLEVMPVAQAWAPFSVQRN